MSVDPVTPCPFVAPGSTLTGAHRPTGRARHLAVAAPLYLQRRARGGSGQVRR